MKLNYDKKSKDPTYFIQMGVRNGKKTTTKNVARIGKHSELLKITDDPLAYAKEQVKKYNEEYKNNKTLALDLKIDFDEKIKADNTVVSVPTDKNIGYFYLQYIYNQLDIKSFFQKVTEESKIKFDADLVNRFITFARILDPDSKLGSFQNLSKYYEQPSFEYVHILRTMDLLKNHYDEYLTNLFECSNKIVKRNTSICYYDCTNYYFETECEDEDYIDEITGEVLKGLRKYGPSKEHRPNPIVEMGLFMDADGIPLSMCLTSGSDNEQTTAIPLEKKLNKMFKGKKFIYCADAGLGSLKIRNFNSIGERAFIVTQSIKKLSSKLQEAIFNDYDYRLLSSNRSCTIKTMKEFDKHDVNNLSLYNDQIYKILNADSALDVGLFEEKICKNGKVKKVKSKAVIKQKIIVTFSRKMMEYQRYIRNRQIERAKNILKTLDPEEYRKGPNDVTRFIKRVKKSNGREEYMIDQDQIDREEKYDGFYAVATNLDDDAKTILGISQNRYKIEDCFRIMKTNFSSRPVYHRNADRITAHFMICYTALLIYRILEKLLADKNYRFSVSNIIETMQNMNVSNIQDLCYMSNYTCSQVCTALNEVTGLELNKRYYSPKSLNQKLRKISR